MLVESLLLSLAGTVLGLLLAQGGLSALEPLVHRALPLTGAIPLQGRIFAFLLLAATASAVLFGLVPALQVTRGDLRGGLLEAGTRLPASRSHHHRDLVAQRTREIGIRVALGAGTGDVVWLVMRQGALLTVLRIGVGVAGALGLSRLVESLIYGVSAQDPFTFAALAGLLGCVALVATWLPARRAARVDPVAAIKSVERKGVAKARSAGMAAGRRSEARDDEPRRTPTACPLFAQCQTQ